MKQILRAHTPNILATLCVVALLFLFGSEHRAAAQCTSQGCSTVVWGPPQTFVLTVSSGCVVAVSVRMRTCPGPPSTCEYYFDNISNLCCPSTPPSTYDLVRSVAVAVLSNLWPNQCGLANPKVYFPKCWSGSGGSAAGCSTSPCCTFDGTNYNTPPGSCTFPCTAMCP